MNYALILAGGVGQRMRNSGKPKQFLDVFGKPIIVYTIEKFEECDDIDKIVIACNSAWIDYMNTLLDRNSFQKVMVVVPGGINRQASVENGIVAIQKDGGCSNDIVVIHDGVRPLINPNVISENIRVANKYGAAMTVKPVIESVVVAEGNDASYDNFKKRDDTCSLTSPQTFTISVLEETLRGGEGKKSDIPVLDMAIAYTSLGNRIHLVKDNEPNIKITTPEDYYILKALIELEESKSVFGF